MYYRNDFQIECPTGSGNQMSLLGVAREIQHVPPSTPSSSNNSVSATSSFVTQMVNVLATHSTAKWTTIPISVITSFSTSTLTATPVVESSHLIRLAGLV